MISVAVVEDIKDIREPLFEFLSNQDEFLCEVKAGSVEEYLELINDKLPVDVVLLDIGLPGLSGLGAIQLIKERTPETQIIMLTVFDDPNKIFRALQSGAIGYLLKNTPLMEIKKSILEAYSGGSPLSPDIARKVVRFFEQPKSVIKNPLTEKEKEIVAGMVDGLSFKMIAANMGNSIETIKSHTKNIYRKLHVNCKAEVIAKSLRGEI
ncbi:MAG: DNA-binding response regulator [Ignavibacteria bacterium]|nr:MAG: DNA-binding response regulator [Ignavibacteria bacterium]